MPKLIDLTGQTFNQLTVLKRDSTNTNEGNQNGYANVVVEILYPLVVKT